MLKITCIIPAYKEAARIGEVLKIVQNHPLLDEIIVVDDASNDGTGAIVRSFAGTRLITKEKNGGKTMAIYDGIKASKGDFLFLLDSDLVGLTSKNISDLAEPVLSGKADITISLRKNSPWHWLGIDYISGERIFPKRLLSEHLEEMPHLAYFGLEVFMNKWIIKNRYKIKVISWPNVISPTKARKIGWYRGFQADIFMMRDIFKTVSVFGAIYQIIAMFFLRLP